MEFPARSGTIELSRVLVRAFVSTGTFLFIPQPSQIWKCVPIFSLFFPKFTPLLELICIFIFFLCFCLCNADKNDII